IYAGLEDVELIGVIDTLKARAEEIAALYRTAAFTNYQDIFGKADAVSLAVPTVDHARIGIHLLQRGIDVLVEKPIAATVEGAKALIEAAIKYDRVLQVGHVERFNPIVAAAREA